MGGNGRGNLDRNRGWEGSVGGWRGMREEGAERGVCAGHSERNVGGDWEEIGVGEWRVRGD